WMRRTASYDDAENLADARALARLMRTLNELALPTIARINGAALGGGTGLVACCDVAVASELASFGTTEVRLGLIPAVIGPYVIAAIGPRAARKLMLTGERISASEAARIGLVHEVAPADRLDAAVDAVLDHILKCGPEAVAAAKRLVRELTGRTITPEVVDDTARRIAALRATAEAREGLGAFLEKRRPTWLA
ncbi:MAG: enoyl-CoA hydratase-related protein, partial [Geminicoccaceae bacterium]